MNLYGFVGNHPVFGIDYNGLFIDRLIGAAIGGVISGGINVTVAVLRGDSARDVIIAGASGFVGGAVTGVLLTPPPLASPSAAGAIGGAVTGFLSSASTEYFRMEAAGEKPEVTIRATVNVVASTILGGGLGFAGGKLGERIADVADVIWIPLRSAQVALGLEVKISGACTVTEGSLGIVNAAVSSLQTAANAAYDVGRGVMHRENVRLNEILEEDTKIKEDWKTHSVDDE